MRQILLSIRMLLRFKVYTVVNFIGLAISLACVFTITRYIHQENTVDHCYPEYKRICFIERSISDGTKELAGYQSDLEKDPAVERYASFTPCSDLVMDFGKQEITVNALSVDSAFFSIFPYSIYMGSGKIKRPNDALITKEFW
ncbi:ABC transporter permease, partial [Bacteroides intestinalis]|uniref:ABC transporter permease n=2 Tax=Bacteroides TaxID=816 RepID=UPI0032D3A55F